jgi:cytoskeletal protein RodZ
MPTVGQQLRQARLGKGLELAALAEQTRISRYYLEALESDQPERLPGPFFYKAFVRQYCGILGLDAKQFQQEFTERVGEETLSIEELRQAKFPARERDPIMRAVNPQHGDMRFVLAAGGLIAMLLGGSFVYTWMQKPDLQVQTAGSGSVTLPVGVRASIPEVESKPAAAVAEAQTLTMPGASTAPPVFPNGAELQNASVVNLTPNIGSSDAAVSLSISAQEATWINITTDGKTIYEGTLEPAQARTLAGRANAVVKIGNAAGVQVKWNGKSIGPLGQRGQVRMVMFTDKGWQFVGTPAAPVEQPKTVSTPKVTDI